MWDTRRKEFLEIIKGLNGISRSWLDLIGLNILRQRALGEALLQLLAMCGLKHCNSMILTEKIKMSLH